MSELPVQAHLLAAALSSDGQPITAEEADKRVRIARARATMLDSSNARTQFNQYVGIIKEVTTQIKTRQQKQVLSLSKRRKQLNKLK